MTGEELAQQLRGCVDQQRAKRDAAIMAGEDWDIQASHHIATGMELITQIAEMTVGLRSEIDLDQAGLSEANVNIEITFNDDTVGD